MVRSAGITASRLPDQIWQTTSELRSLSDSHIGFFSIGMFARGSSFTAGACGQLPASLLSRIVTNFHAVRAGRRATLPSFPATSCGRDRPVLGVG